MSHAYTHFSHVSGSPRPLEHSSLFGGTGSGSSYASSEVSQQLQDLIGQVNSQSSVLNDLVGAVTGKSGGSSSALSGILGGSVLGSVASSGFSVTSLLKDILPLGGLISGIAGLFSSTPTPAALDQYDAPPSLNFDAVLNANGTLSQGSGDQYGQTRASSAGLDMADAAGGPYSPYARATNGSLTPVAGDPTTKYPGMINLPDLVGSLTQSPAQAGSPASAAAPASTTTAPITDASSSSLTSSSSNNPGSAQPNFDAQWFNDHGSLIASAVRNELLNFHPIVDTINDL